MRMKTYILINLSLATIRIDRLMCSEETVQRSCGDEAALFTSTFLKRMASNMIKDYCFQYNRQECELTNKGSHNISHSVLLFISVASVINLAFYASGSLIPTSTGSVFGSGNKNVFGSEAEFSQFNSTPAVIYSGVGVTASRQQKPASNFWSVGKDGLGSTDVEQQPTTRASTIFGNTSDGSFSTPSPAFQAFGTPQAPAFDGGENKS